MTTLFHDFIFATQKQAIFDLLLNKAFNCLIFKSVFEDIYSSYETETFRITEVIASFPKFCNFGDIIPGLDVKLIYTNKMQIRCVGAPLTHKV